MAKERTLNFSSIIIVNPETANEARYAWIKNIDIPDEYSDSYGPYYAVRKFGDNLWGVIDDNGNIVIDLIYKKINTWVVSYGYQDVKLTVTAERDDGKVNLVDLATGREIFAEWYNRIGRIKDDCAYSSLCLLNNGSGNIGIADVASGNILLALEYATVFSLGKDTYKYIVHDNEQKWGIIDSNGEWIREISYENTMRGNIWCSYNVAKYKISGTATAVDILNYDGRIVYSLYCHSCCRLRRGKHMWAENAFVFVDPEWRNRKQNARLVILDEGHGKTNVLEYDYKINNGDTCTRAKSIIERKGLSPIIIATDHRLETDI